MAASPSSPQPTFRDATAQRRLGHALGDGIDRLADASPVLDDAASAIKAAIAPVAGDAAPPSVRDALLGSWLGHPLHPIIVTLPLGAWTLTSLFDLLGEERAADLCLRVGVVGAVSAALSGLAQWNEVTDRERPRRIGVMHSSLNTVATGLYVGSWVLRARGQRHAGVVTAVAGLAVTSLSGWLGGHLSYTLGVGVEEDAFTRQAAEGSMPAGSVAVDEDAPQAEPDQALDMLAR